jgi:hypothetical protein
VENFSVGTFDQNWPATANTCILLMLTDFLVLK